MKKITYHKNKIKNITENGIQYTDNSGNLGFIDFEVCRENWTEYVNSSEDFNVTNLSIDETKCVGYRNITDNHPYIDFFTEPKIRFEFKFSLSCLFPKQAFIEMQARIIQVGWTTYDLS